MSKHDCKHENKQVTKKQDKNGNMIFFNQCLICGFKGEAIKKSIVARFYSIDDVPITDEYKIRESFRQNKLPYIRQRRIYDRRVAYNNYIYSTEWQKIRLKIVQIRNCKCEICGSFTDLQCHHKNYTNLFNEGASDLMLLCKSCHSECHRILEYINTKIEKSERLKIAYHYCEQKQYEAIKDLIED